MLEYPLFQQGSFPWERITVIFHLAKVISIIFYDLKRSIKVRRSVRPLKTTLALVAPFLNKFESLIFRIPHNTILLLYVPMFSSEALLITLLVVLTSFGRNPQKIIPVDVYKVGGGWGEWRGSVSVNLQVNVQMKWIS